MKRSSPLVSQKWQGHNTHEQLLPGRDCRWQKRTCLRRDTFELVLVLFDLRNMNIVRESNWKVLDNSFRLKAWSLLQTESFFRLLQGRGLLFWKHLENNRHLAEYRVKAGNEQRTDIRSRDLTESVSGPRRSPVQVEMVNVNGRLDNRLNLRIYMFIKSRQTKKTNKVG